ncbi:hypothetical protein L596_010635 [Steinernema carpocapsae]|nr:hypothetical protein L596_010635 [Steinernema carpocapsae]
MFTVSAVYVISSKERKSSNACPEQCKTGPKTADKEEEKTLLCRFSSVFQRMAGTFCDCCVGPTKKD